MGAYQAGVYQALDEKGFCPDWVVGTSIGAINAALIAGNPPASRLAKLQAFWYTVSQDDAIPLELVTDTARRKTIQWSTLAALVRGIPGFFLPRLFSPFRLGLPVTPDQASFYDTGVLAATLSGLVDFDYLNAPGNMRLTVNALKVTSGELVSFDSQKQVIDVNHILASGALPPGFPPVRIDGELYWDGGLYSNTPIETIFDDTPPVDTLCFMVDLWRAQGPEPTTLEEVQTRQKDVTFASRSSRHVESYRRTHNLQCMLQMLYQKLPENLRMEVGKEVLEALVPETTIHIVRLVYPGRDWQMASKDINFSKGSIQWRWEQGYRDAAQAIEEAGWLASLSGHNSVIVHDIVRNPGTGS